MSKLGSVRGSQMTVDEEEKSPIRRKKGLELIDFDTRKEMFLGNKVS